MPAFKSCYPQPTFLSPARSGHLLQFTRSEVQYRLSCTFLCGTQVSSVMCMCLLPTLQSGPKTTGTPTDLSMLVTAYSRKHQERGFHCCWKP